MPNIFGHFWLLPLFIWVMVAMADEVLEIPSHGMKNSLNVVSAFAVAAAFFRIPRQEKEKGRR